MIRIFKKLSREDALSQVNTFETGCWVNIINPDEKEINEICERFNIPRQIITDSLDDDENPRTERQDDIIHTIIKAPYKSKDGNVSVISLGIIITPKNIITVSLKEINVISDFYEKVMKNFYTTKKTRFIVQVFGKSNFYYQKYLDGIEKKINSIEKELLKSSRNEEVIQLLNIQKSLVYINTAVISNKKVLEKIIQGNFLKLYKEDEEMLEDIMVDNEQSIDMAGIYSNLLANTMDAYASIISNNLNIVMKFLASVTILMAIPTIIAGFYGMNVKLPLQESPMAFMFTILISFALTFSAMFVFIKNKFL